MSLRQFMITLYLIIAFIQKGTPLDQLLPLISLRPLNVRNVRSEQALAEIQRGGDKDLAVVYRADRFIRQRHLLLRRRGQGSDNAVLARLRGGGRGTLSRV